MLSVLALNSAEEGTMELHMITISEELVEHALKEYELPLIGFAISIVRDYDHARDVVQDSFIRLYKQDVEKVKGSLKSWLLPCVAIAL